VSPLIADPEPRVVAAYSLFGPAGNGPLAPRSPRVPDRPGRLSARALGAGDKPDWNRIQELLAQVETLNREGPHEAAQTGHVH